MNTGFKWINNSYEYFLLWSKNNSNRCEMMTQYSGKGWHLSSSVAVIMIQNYKECKKVRKGHNNYLVIGPGDSVTAFIDERIWLWNDPSHDGDFFKPGGTLAPFGELLTFSLSNLITTCDPVFGVGLSNNFVHAKSKSNDDWSVAILSGFAVISLQMNL